jgi:protoporphyrinogen oxidase
MICPWTDKFIPQFDLSDVVNGYFQENENDFGYNAFFWYPKKGGIGQLSLALEKQIGKVSKNCQVSEINLKDKEITIAGKGKEKFDILILTTPLPELAKIVKALPGKILNQLDKLQWNSIFNLNLGLEGSCQNGKHWVYFPDKKTVFFRAGFYHNFSNAALTGKSSLYAEVSYAKNKSVNKEKMIKEILGGLCRSKIICKKNKILALDTNDIKYGYPIYDQHYSQATQEIRQFLSSRGVIACGRYGNWQYMSMEDVILDGKRVAQELYKK